MIKNFFTYNISLPLFDRVKKYHVKRYFEFLKNAEKWNKDQLNAYRNQRLQNLITYAYRNVVFYKNRMDDLGLIPDDFKNIEDLKKLPTLSRRDLQSNFKELISRTDNIQNCYKGSSSGSTGEPVTYYQDRKSISANLGALYYGWSLSGWRFGDKMLTIWGTPTTVNVDWRRKSSKLKSLLFNEIKYPAYILTLKKEFDNLLMIYKRESILYIQGYTNSIYLFAEYIKQTGKHCKKCKGVLTTAETLQPYQRSSIESVLGPVFDFYGCGEIMGIGVQCKHRGHYHIIDPHVIVEYGDTPEDIEDPDIIVTDLDNYVMPFIKYRIGDMIVPSENESCVCNSPFKTFRKIMGRTGDIIQTPDGRHLTIPSFLGSGLLKELSGLKQYQVIRTAKDRLIVRLAINDQFDDFQHTKIYNALESYIPDSMSWEIQTCDYIEPYKNGKFKFVVDKTLH